MKGKMPVAFVVVLAGAALAFLYPRGGSQTLAQRQEAPPRWEYKVVWLDASEIAVPAAGGESPTEKEVKQAGDRLTRAVNDRCDEVAKKYNALAAEGWEEVRTVVEVPRPEARRGRIWVEGPLVLFRRAKK